MGHNDTTRVVKVFAFWWKQAQRTDNEADVVSDDAKETDRDASELLILVREATEETNSKCLTHRNSLVRLIKRIFSAVQLCGRRLLRLLLLKLMLDSELW